MDSYALKGLITAFVRHLGTECGALGLAAAACGAAADVLRAYFYRRRGAVVAIVVISAVDNIAGNIASRFAFVHEFHLLTIRLKYSIRCAV